MSLSFIECRQGIDQWTHWSERLLDPLRQNRFSLAYMDVRFAEA